LSRVQRPTKHIIGHIGDGFYGSNDPTSSVKALKEVVVLKIRLQSHQVHLTRLQYYTCMYYTVARDGLEDSMYKAKAEATDHKNAKSRQK